MFGKNVVTAPFRNDFGDLLVNDLFYTIQGEGPDAGRPAIFLRLSKCNLRCYFCDTEFESGVQRPIEWLRNALRGMRESTGCDLLVITGGEPLLQNIIPLIEWCNSELNMSVSIETAGTVWLPGLDRLFACDRSISGNLIVCSPKTPSLNMQLSPLIGALKYIIAEGEVDVITGIPNRSTQMPGKEVQLFLPTDAPFAEVYLQAQDPGDKKTSAGKKMQHEMNQALTTELCMKFGYRQSVQIHKILGLP